MQRRHGAQPRARRPTMVAVFSALSHPALNFRPAPSLLPARRFRTLCYLMDGGAHRSGYAGSEDGLQDWVMLRDIFLFAITLSATCAPASSVPRHVRLCLQASGHVVEHDYFRCGKDTAMARRARGTHTNNFIECKLGDMYTCMNWQEGHQFPTEEEGDGLLEIYKSGAPSGPLPFAAPVHASRWWSNIHGSGLVVQG